MSTRNQITLFAMIMAAFAFIAIALRVHKLSIDGISRRLSAVETNAVLSLEMLSRAERVVGTIEREMQERQQPNLTHLTNLPAVVFTPGVLSTNVIVLQDAQGNWRVQWPTNNP